MNIFCTSTAVLHSIGPIHYQTRAPCGEENTFFTMLKFFKNEQNKISAADEHLNDKKFDEIKVIGAGLPRTGTLSLKTALTQLYGGEEFWFNCVHPMTSGDVGVLCHVKTIA